MDLKVHVFDIFEEPEREPEGTYYGVVALEIPDSYVTSGDLKIRPEPLLRTLPFQLVPFDIFKHSGASSPILDPQFEDDEMTLSEELYRKIRTIVQSHPELASFFPKRKTA